MFKKLLFAGSIAALSAASAHAQLAADLATTALTPALELELPSADSDTFIFGAAAVIESGGSFPSGVPYLVEVTLPAGVTFSTNIGVNNLRNNADDIPAVPADDPTTDVTISTGGAVGDSSVTFLVTSTNVENLFFNGAFSLDDCVAEDAGFEIGVNLVAGVPISGGSATSDAIINECASGLDGEVTAEGSDSMISLSGNFESINEGLMGSVNYDADMSVVIGAGLTPAYITAADIASIAFDVEFDDVTGLDAITLSTGTSVTLAGTTASFLITDAGEIADLVDGTADDLTLTAATGADAAPILAQNVTVSNAVVTFNDTRADLIATEAGAEGDLDSLVREGQTFGPFDWNDGRAGRTTSVYRVTGLVPSAPVDYTVTLTNSNRDGSYSGTLMADSVGEFVMTSVGFGGIVPTFGRGDASFNFETTDEIDVDRLMVRNGISTDFGGGANSSLSGDTPSTDTDNTDGTE